MADPTPLHDQTQTAGAVFAEEAGWLIPLHYGDPQAEYDAALRSAVVFDCSSRSKVEVSGPDAATFLHNLTTNDVKEMPLGAGCEAFLTTATAKAVEHLFIYHVMLSGGRHAFLLDLEPARGEGLIKHLDRYLISEAVEMSDRTREFAQLHLAGPQATDVLQRALVDEIPNLEPLLHMERTFGSRSHAHLRRHDALNLPGYDLVFLNSFASTIWTLLLSAGARPAGSETYHRLRIEAGTPIYGKDIDENRFVPEVGRIPQTICYTKGCYLGQEPIVMARDRGQVQRSLLGLLLTGESVLPTGCKVFAADKEVGVTTSSVFSPRLGQVIALAYLRRAHQEPGTLVEVEADGGRREARVVAIPFAGTR